MARLAIAARGRLLINVGDIRISVGKPDCDGIRLRNIMRTIRLSKRFPAAALSRALGKSPNYAVQIETIETALPRLHTLIAWGTALGLLVTIEFQSDAFRQ